MSGAQWELRAHESVHDRITYLSSAPIPEELWIVIVELMRRVMTDPDSCKRQAIRWPSSDISAYLVMARSQTCDVQVWWSFVDELPYVWALTFDPALER